MFEDAQSAAARVAGRAEPGDALRVGLLRRSAHAGHFGVGHHQLAQSVAGADDGRKVPVDGVLHRVEDVIGVHVNQRRVAGHRAGPFEIEVRFIDIAFDDSRVARSGDEEDLRIVRRQPVLSPKLLEIGELDARLAGNDDTLSRPVDPRIVQGREVVDGGQVGGRDIMPAARRGVSRFQCVLEGARAEVVEPLNRPHDAAEALGNGRLGGVGEVRLAVLDILVKLGLKGALDLAGVAAEADPGPAARHRRDAQALALQPRANRAQVALADAETLRIVFGAEPAMVVRRARSLLANE